MIKFCSCGVKETIQPYQDCSWIKVENGCTRCRRKRLVLRKTVMVERKEAVSFFSNVKFRKST